MDSEPKVNLVRDRYIVPAVVPIIGYLDPPIDDENIEVSPYIKFKSPRASEEYIKLESPCRSQNFNIQYIRDNLRSYCGSMEYIYIFLAIFAVIGFKITISLVPYIRRLQLSQITQSSFLIPVALFKGTFRVMRSISGSDKLLILMAATATVGLCIYIYRTNMYVRKIVIQAIKDTTMVIIDKEVVLSTGISDRCLWNHVKDKCDIPEETYTKVIRALLQEGYISEVERVGWGYNDIIKKKNLIVMGPRNERLLKQWVTEIHGRRESRSTRPVIYYFCKNTNQELLDKYKRSGGRHIYG